MDGDVSDAEKPKMKQSEIERMQFGFALLQALTLVDKVYHGQWNESKDQPVYDSLCKLARNLCFSK